MFRKIFIKVNTARYGCSNFNPSDIIEPKAKSSSSSSSHDDHHHQKNPSRPIVTSSSSTSSREKANSTTSFSLNTTASPTCSDHDFVSSKLRDSSVAILKESKDPFLDFRGSMLEMIYENEIYSKDELRELLDLFLELNSACYHRVIVKAFMEIWNCVFSSREACESIEFDPGNLHGGK